MSDLSERRGLRVGDKVFVAHGTYKGHYGIIVGGAKRERFFFDFLVRIRSVAGQL